MPFVNDLLKYVHNYFVETGTLWGDTSEKVYLNNNNVKILTLELSPVLFNDCKKRFKDIQNIELYNVNSKYHLFDCIKDINDKITFWLDGHWSNTPNVGFDPETLCPILFELEQIKKHHIKTHTIMIDDIRLMDNIHFKTTKEEIIQKLYEINPDYNIKYYDDGIETDDVLVAYIDV